MLATHLPCVFAALVVIGIAAGLLGPRMQSLPSSKELLAGLGALLVALLATVPNYAEFMNERRDAAIAFAASNFAGGSGSVSNNLAMNDWVSGATLCMITFAVLIAVGVYIVKSDLQGRQVKTAKKPKDSVAIALLFTFAVVLFMVILGLGFLSDLEQIQERGTVRFAQSITESKANDYACASRRPNGSEER